MDRPHAIIREQLFPSWAIRVEKLLGCGEALSLQLQDEAIDPYEDSEVLLRAVAGYLDRLLEVLDYLSFEEADRSRLGNAFRGIGLQPIRDSTQAKVWLESGLLYTQANFLDLAGVPSEREVCEALEAGLSTKCMN